MTKTKQKIGKNTERGKKLMEWRQSWEDKIWTEGGKATRIEEGCLGHLAYKIFYFPISTLWPWRCKDMTKISLGCDKFFIFSFPFANSGIRIVAENVLNREWRYILNRCAYSKANLICLNSD